MYAKASEVAGIATANFSASVSKAVVSNNFRLVFLAGFEGSGHHYFKTAEETMFQANPDLPRIGNNCQLSPHPYYLPSCMSGGAHAFAGAEHRAKEEMKKLREQSASLPLGGTICTTSSAYSYPLEAGPNKVMQYFDLLRLAEVAEAESIDMRVVYMRRSAKDMIIANTVHRRFQK